MGYINAVNLNRRDSRLAQLEISVIILNINSIVKVKLYIRI